MAIYTSQPDETSGIDTFLYSGAATTNYGTNPEIFVGELNSAADDYRCGLIKFDLSSIPASAHIMSATLSLWTSGDYCDTAHTLQLYRSLRAWVESQATWNIYSTGNNWGTAGSGNSTTDYDGANLWASKSMANNVANNTEIQLIFNATGLVELKKFIDGTYTNNGWLIYVDTWLNTTYGYHSSSVGTAGYRPKLTIEFGGGGLMLFSS